jgi:hypothetical protein
MARTGPGHSVVLNAENGTRTIQSEAPEQEIPR